MPEYTIPPRVAERLRAVHEQRVRAEAALNELCMVTAEAMGIDTQSQVQTVAFDLDAGVIRVSDVE